MATLIDDYKPGGGLLQHHALPIPEKTVPSVPARVPKHFLAAFFLSLFLGVFGADRFYLGRYWSGALKLITFGGFGISAIVDLALIMNGAMRDRYDRPLVGYEEYKGLAKRTVAWVTVGIALFVLVNGIFLIIAVEQAINSFKSGALSGLSGGSSSDPSASSLLSL